jgi:hypothetical protein
MVINRNPKFILKFHSHFHELTMDVISRVAIGQPDSRQFHQSSDIELAKLIFVYGVIGVGKFEYDTHFSSGSKFLHVLSKPRFVQ